MLFPELGEVVSDKDPTRYEGGIGALVGLGTLVIQGIFLVPAIQNPAEISRWLLWAVVLVLLIVADVFIIRAVLRRRS